jgi:hypothetical protein
MFPWIITLGSLCICYVLLGTELRMLGKGSSTELQTHTFLFSALLLHCMNCVLALMSRVCSVFYVCSVISLSSSPKVNIPGLQLMFLPCFLNVKSHS